MRKPLRILHLEDDPDFHDLVHSLLQADGIEAQIKLVSTRREFEVVLAEGDFDIILADYLVPEFNGIEALRLAHKKVPETPFLLVSGTIGEQAAIDSLRAGATDYVLKQWPERLVPAIRRAATEAEERAHRRRVETELIRREKHFRTLTENALDIVTAVSKEGYYLYNSPSLKRVLGYEPAEMTGRSPFEFVHPEDLPSVQQAFLKAQAHPEGAITLDFRFRHQSGAWRYLEAVGRSHLDDPEIYAVIVNSRDITDRKEAEAALRESEKQYRLIFDGNPTPMYVFDQETLALLEVNDAAVHHYGFSREELLGMNLRELRPAEDVPALIEYVHRLMVAGEPTKLGLAGVWRHVKKNGSLIDVEIKWSPVSFHGRKASLVMANDITERKRVEHRDAVLSKLGQSLSSATSPEEAANIIRGVADELFRWDSFTLDHYRSELDLIYPILNVDTDREGKRFDIQDNGPGREPSRMAQRIVSSGAELILREDPIVLAGDTVPIGDVSRPSASLMVVPIRNRTRVIGILSIQSYTLHAYTPQDLNTLQTLADHCGGALERIRAEQACRES
jgi:PAS domain S-box-containing protein